MKILRVPRGIALRITMLGWTVTLVTLCVFVMVIIPEQKREFQLNLESKARGIAVSIQAVAAGAAVSEDYSAVVEATQALSADAAIEHVVIAKSDGYSIVINQSNWRIETLGPEWRPAKRIASGSIATSRLFGHRLFEYSDPFDYSGIQWGWIHVGLSLKDYDASVARIYKRTAALAVLCGALSLVSSLIYAARLVRPIQTLRAAVGKVALGDLHARAEVQSGDEIEQLAGAFNDMAGTILERNQILESVSFAAKQFLSAPDPDTAAQEVLEKIVQATGVGSAYVLKLDTRGGAMRMKAKPEWSSSTANMEVRKIFPWQAASARRWAEILSDGRIVTVRPAELEPALRREFDLRARSTIMIPIAVANVWWGVIGFDDFVKEREWGEAERDSLHAVADILGAAIARQRVRRALVEAKETLEQRVLERTVELREEIAAKDRANAELAAAQQRMIELSREAGMAEIATGVLHNVGNVLNSVNVSASLVAGKVRESRVGKLAGLSVLLEQHSDDLAAFLTGDPKGQRALPYLAKLSGHLNEERDDVLKELELLTSHVGHIKQIVGTQQSYAKVSGLIETISLPELVEDAVRILEPSLTRHRIRIERDFEALPVISANKHQILQILLNLLRNAKQARQPGEEIAAIRVRLRRAGTNRVSVAVQDSGVGLAPENLTRIFAHGFTTKADGHGFGLHSCAIAASQMHGSLRAESEGLGRGATFILELPVDGNREIEERNSGVNAT